MVSRFAAISWLRSLCARVVSRGTPARACASIAVVIGAAMSAVSLATPRPPAAASDVSIAATVTASLPVLPLLHVTVAHRVGFAPSSMPRGSRPIHTALAERPLSSRTSAQAADAVARLGAATYGDVALARGYDAIAPPALT